MIKTRVDDETTLDDGTVHVRFTKSQTMFRMVNGRVWTRKELRALDRRERRARETT